MGCCSNWLRGNWKHSENSRKKLKFLLKNCKIGRQGRENSPQSARQKSPTALKRLDISIKRTLKIGHRLCWFCAIQQRKWPVTSFVSQALGAPEGIRTPGIWRRSLPTALPLPQTAKQLSQSNSLSWICNLVFLSFLLHQHSPVLVSFTRMGLCLGRWE